MRTSTVDEVTELLTSTALAAAVRAGDCGVAELIADPASAATYIADTIAALSSAGLVDEADVRHAAPIGDRWSVSELTEAVLAPAGTMPRGRGWLIVVADAASMAPAASSRLLRTIEEPTAPAWFVLCHDLSEQLDVPVRGRVTFHEVLDEAAGQDGLRRAADAAGQLDTLEALLGAPLGDRPTLVEVQAWTAQARELANALRPKPAGPWLRKIVRAAGTRWADEASDALRSAAGDRAVIDATGVLAAALADSLEALARFSPPEGALGPTFVARRQLCQAATAART